MPQPKRGPRFGGSPAHHDAIMANLATELFRHGRIRTTAARAKHVQPIAERMITFAKRGDVHARRQVLTVIRDKDVVHKLFADVGPAFADRNGGYTRVLKLGPRKGDAAPMALIELVAGVDSTRGEGQLEEAPRRRWSLRRRRGTISATARAREEDRLAAVDAGIAPDVEEPFVEEEPAPDPGAERLDDADAPEADPAEVEARLAAQDEGEDIAPVPSEDQDAPEPERVPDADTDEDTPQS